MTFIAKAMNKTERLESAEERAQREEAAREASRTRPGGAATKSIGSASNGELPHREALDTARTLARLGSRPPAAGGGALATSETLETIPEPPVDNSAAAPRPWFREPLVIAGIALGFVALLSGFLLAPGAGGDDAGGNVRTTVDSDGAPSSRSPMADGEAGGNSARVMKAAESPSAASFTANAGGKPVVVTVQIDSGDSGRVELEAPPATDSTGSPGAPSAGTLQPPPSYDSLVPLELPPPPVFDRESEPEREPETTRSSRPSGSSIEDYTLEGIFYSEEDPGAIINDTIVSVGKQVGQMKVLEIKKSSVIVELNGRTYDLH